MPQLFDSLQIRGLTLRNRIGLSPMCQYSYTDGFSNDWQLVHLGTRAAGGAALVIAEATAVEARGRITPDDLGIWSDEHIEGLARVARFVKSQGAAAGIQIAHAGRKASTARPWDGGHPIPASDPRGWQVVGPGSLPFSDAYPVPHQLSVEEIAGITQSFAAAAGRVLAAGFDWLEIHAGHGYLLHSFYSPLSNNRTDQYGGSFDNRIRLLLEVTQAVRAVWPERMPLGVRISGAEWVEGGWSIEDSASLARNLNVAGVDLIDCSSGGNVAGAKIPVGAGYQVPISEGMKRGAEILTAAVGMITSPAQADEIIRNGRADMVFLGREMLRDPNWPIHAAQALKQPFAAPVQYGRAYL
jgi:2,4-dienoyl-CoA reductase-like NADH-dependent reductase (Old Yellow Enzyme family)